LHLLFCGREDIIPEIFRRLLYTLYGAKHNDDRMRHFIYCIALNQAWLRMLAALPGKWRALRS